MRVAECLDDLRRRFQLVRGERRGLDPIAREIGINRIALAQWLAKDRSTRMHIVDAIEAWVEQEETHTDMSALEPGP